MKLRKTLFYLAAGTLFLVLLAIAFLFHPGVQKALVYQALNRFEEVQISFVEVRIRPRSITLTEVDVVSEDGRYSLDHVTLRWRPLKLLRERELVIEDWTWGKLRVDLLAREKIDRTGEERFADRFAGIFPLLDFPLAMVWPETSLDLDVRYRDGDLEKQFSGQVHLAGQRRGGETSVTLEGVATGLWATYPAAPLSVRVDLSAPLGTAAKDLPIHLELAGSWAGLGDRPAARLHLAATAEKVVDGERYQGDLRLSTEDPGEGEISLTLEAFFQEKANRWEAAADLSLAHRLAGWWDGAWAGIPGSTELRSEVSYAMKTGQLEGRLSLQGGEGLWPRFAPPDLPAVDGRMALTMAGGFNEQEETWHIGELQIEWTPEEGENPVLSIQTSRPMEGSFSDFAGGNEWWRTADLRAELNTFPLPLLNPFLPEGVRLADGILSGRVQLQEEEVRVEQGRAERLLIDLTKSEASPDTLTRETRRPLALTGEDLVWPSFLFLDEVRLEGTVREEGQEMLSFSTIIEQAGPGLESALHLSVRWFGGVTEESGEPVRMAGTFQPVWTDGGALAGMNWEMRSRLPQADPVTGWVGTGELRWEETSGAWVSQSEFAPSQLVGGHLHLSAETSFIPATQEFRFAPSLGVETVAAQPWMETGFTWPDLRLVVQGEGTYGWLEETGTLSLEGHIPDLLPLLQSFGVSLDASPSARWGMEWRLAEDQIELAEGRIQLAFAGAGALEAETLTVLPVTRLSGGLEGLLREAGSLLSVRFNDLSWSLLNPFLPELPVALSAENLAGTVRLAVDADQALSLSFAEPMQLRGLQLADVATGAPLTEPLTLRLAPHLRWAGEPSLEWSVAALQVTTEEGDLLGELRIADRKLPFTELALADYTVNATIDLPLLLRQPVAAELALPLSRGTGEAAVKVTPATSSVEGEFVLRGIRHRDDRADRPLLSLPFHFLPGPDDRHRLMLEVVQEDRAGRQKVTLEGTVSTLHPARDMALRLSGQNLDLARWEGWGDFAPVASTVQPSSPPPPGGPAPRADQPLWAPFTGEVMVDLTRVSVAPGVMVDQWRQILRLEDDRLHHVLEGMIKGSPLQGEQTLRFVTNGGDLYQLTGQMRGNSLPLQAFVQPDARGVRMIEGLVSWESRFQSSANDPADLFERLQGQFLVEASEGVIRPLAGDDPVRRILGTALRVPGLAGGLFGQTGIGQEIQAIDDFIALFREMPFDRFVLAIERVDNLDTLFRQIVFDSPEIRLRGTGRIPHRPELAFVDQPVQGQLQLFARGRAGTLLRQIRLRGEAADEEGFYPMVRTIPLQGTVRRLDFDPFFRMVIDGAMGRLRGGSTEPPPEEASPPREDPRPGRSIEDEILRRLPRLIP